MLVFHESVHLVLSFAVGIIAYLLLRKAKPKTKPVVLLFTVFSALLGGFFIDIDHLFDYVMAFGFKFNNQYFFKGYQFLKSGKLYIPLHDWELVILCFIGALLIFFLLNFLHFKTVKPLNLLTLQLLLLSFGISLCFHLFVDVQLDRIYPQCYSVIYRYRHHFQIKDCVSAEHYRNDLIRRKLLFSKQNNPYSGSLYSL